MERQEALNWFQEAKFGMMIHWGIYSLLESGEWVMYSRRIPAKEYEKLAADFNPTAFDAEEWVRTAKAAGMRYIVITAKHHDGFSMFRTKVSEFNIVDATPFGRDPMKELCEACKKYGLKLGFYYSHVREWRHPLAPSYEPQGRPDRIGNYGNFWDYPNENCKDLQRYIEEFDMPQLRELLTQYGDIFTIWFDTPSQIMPRQGEQLRDFVHSIQPGCLVNGRISYDIETDYQTMGDREIPACGADMLWDTPMTAGKSWGYSANDVCRPAGELLRELCETAGKGGNYLLNAGPDAGGLIPEGEQQAFREMGEWLRVNGEAIYGSRPAGFRYHPQWGCLTRKGQRLYAMIFAEDAEEIRLTGLKSPVKNCTLLGGGRVPFAQSHRGDSDILTLSPGKNTAGGIRVAAIEYEGELCITDQLIPGDDGSIALFSVDSRMHREYPYSKLILSSGVTARWLNEQDWLEWDFITTEPETSYKIRLVLMGGGFWGLEDFGHELDIVVDGTAYPVSVTEETVSEKCRGSRFVPVGSVHFAEAGRHHLQIRPRKICTQNMAGLTLLGVFLHPEQA